MKKLIPTALVFCMALSGCASGVPQADYDAVVSERDMLKQQISDSSKKSTDDSGTQSKPTQSKEETKPTTGTRKAPAKMNETIAVATRSAQVEITLTEIVRGEEALSIAQAANKFNKVEDGHEIIMTKFKIKNIKDTSGADESFLASSIHFKYADASFTTTVHMASVAGLDDELHAELYEGSEAEGWICFDAVAGEEQPYAVFEGTRDQTVWFDISGK